MVPAGRVNLRLAVAAALAILLGLLVPGSPVAANSDWSSTVGLTSDPSQASNAPRIVASQDGLKLAAVWVRRTGAATGVIQVARSADGGVTWGAPEAVTATAANVENPRIMGSQDLSRIRVFWVQRGASTGTIRTSVSVDGAVWPSATDLTSNLELGDSAAYSVSGAPNGEAVHVVWTEKQSGSGYLVIKWRFSFTGVTWSGEETISPTPGNAARPTVVTTDGGNGATVAWIHVNAPQPRTAQLIRRASGSWSAVRTLSPAGSGTAFDVTLSLLSSIRGTAIWSQFDADSDRVPFISVNSAGTWSDATALGSEDTFDQRAAVAADGSRVAALWGSPDGLKARVRTSGGWQPEVSLPGPAGDQLDLAASTDAKRLVVVWRTLTYALAAATSADGGLTWTSLPSPAAATADLPQVGMADDGDRFAAVWSGRSAGSWYPRAAAGPALLPALSVSSPSIDFQDVRVGESATRSVTLTNTGLALMWVKSAVISGADFGRILSGCGLALPPGGSCSLPVVFAPATLGTKSGTLTITDDAPGSPRTIPLTGNAISPVTPTPSPTPVVRKEQAPRDRKGVPPKRIRKKGLTVVVGSNARTTADQRISTQVKVKAKKGRYRVLTGRGGKLRIRTFGKPLKRVTLVQRAPETSTYLPYERTTVYRKGKRT